MTVETTWCVVINEVEGGIETFQAAECWGDGSRNISSEADFEAVTLLSGRD